MVAVAGVTFIMGSEGEYDEQPHEVTLSDFFMGKTEVTVGQYKTYCNATGILMPIEPNWGWNTNDLIVNVSWHDAVNYCDWLSEKCDENITLPTEAQCEFAARGGNNSEGYKYSAGRSMATAGWYGGNSDQVHTVASKKANELGLYDMSGNVLEWCLDWYDESYYENRPSKNPENRNESDCKVLRGGSWFYRASFCRVANRSFYKPAFRNNDFGFRVVSLNSNH